MNQNIYIGVATLEVHIPDARSLKAKRSSTRKLVEKIRSRHQVLAIEAGHQDLYQRATFAICGMSTNEVDLESRFRRVEQTVYATFSGNVLGWNVEIFHA
jgi:uncharacterized protein YlxP (DUF503 family)